jgi:hypothetical protein
MTRGRKPNVEPTSAINLHLPESLRARLDLVLFSELEGRVPKGSYLRFFSARLAEFFECRTLDLAPYVNALPGTHVVSARPATLDALRAALEQNQQGKL